MIININILIIKYIYIYNQLYDNINELYIFIIIKLIYKIKYMIDFSIGSILKFSNRKSIELIDITKNKNQIITSNQKIKPNNFDFVNFLDCNRVLLTLNLGCNLNNFNFVILYFLNFLY